MLALCAAAIPVAAGAQAAGDVFDRFFRYTEPEHKTFFEGTNGDTVDPFTGTMRIVQEDLVLPGAAGLDLHIVRAYSSKIWGRTDLLTSAEPLLAETEQSVLGYGWTFHFGRLRNPNARGNSGYCSGDFPIFEAPDGTSRVFYPATDPNNTFLGYWRSKDYWRMETSCAALGGNGACVWSSTGMRYEFSSLNQGFYGLMPVWPASGIVDTFGNRISVNYLLPGQFPSIVNVPPVKSVVDTYGRQITFDYTYDVDGARLSKMTANGQVYSYAYTPYGPADTSGTGKFPLPNTRRFLTQVSPPAGPPFSYTYAYSVPVVQNQYALSSITYPSGGTATYVYGNQSFFTGADTVPFAVVTQRTVSGPNLTTGTWTYSYSAPAPGSLSATDPATGNPTDMNVTTVVRPDLKKDTYTYLGFGWVADQNKQGLTYLVGLTHEIARGDRAESEVFIWDLMPAISSVLYAAPSYSGCAAIPYPQLQDGGVYPAAMTKRIVNRDPSSTAFATAFFETDYSNFDDYGQAQTVSEIGTQANSVTYAGPLGTQVIPLRFAGTQTRTSYWTFFHKVDDGATTPRTLNILRGRPLSQTVQVGSESFINSWTYNGPSYARDSETRSGVATTFGYHVDTTEGLGNLKTVTNYTDQTHPITLTLSGYAASVGWGTPTNLDFNGAFTISRTVSWEGWTLSTKDGRGNTTGYGYDAIGRLTNVTPPSPDKNAATVYTWAPDNSSMTLTRGSYSKASTLDGLGRVVSTLDSEHVATSSRYDAMGQAWFKSYPYDSSAVEVGEKFDFDGMGRTTLVTRAFRPSAPNTCDMLGACTITNQYLANCVTTIVARGDEALTTNRCNAAFGDPSEQALAAVADDMGNVWQFGHAVSGGVENVIAPLSKGNRTYSYDPVTQFLVGDTSGESGTTAYGRNALGQMTSRTDARNVIATYAYNDPLSRLTNITYQGDSYQGADDLTKDYDNANNLWHLSSQSGGAYVYGYDELNRVTSQTWTYGGQAYTTTYHYLPSGCLDSMTYPSGVTLTMACDTANRVTSVTLNVNGVVSPIVGNVAYHPSGQITAMMYGDAASTATAIAYDDRARAKTVTAPGVIALSYGYDGADNVTSFNNAALPNSARTMMYDRQNRVIASLAPYQWGTLVYDYDGLGNRIFKSGAVTTTFVYDANNRLDSTLGPETFPSMTFTWDLPGRLASSSDGVTYSYDGHGWRVLKTDANQATVYHHDPSGRVIAETLPDGTKLRDYIYLGNKLIAVDGCISAGATPPCAERQWYHTDTLGSVQARTDSTGAVVARLDYEPWGEQWSVNGAGGDRQYNGRVFDPGTGFHDYGARLYWPEIGRFISADTYGGNVANPASLNRYSYVQNNPCKYTDATGHCPMCVGAIAGAIVGGVAAGIISYQHGIRGEGLVTDILFGVGAGGLAGMTLGAGVGMLAGSGAAAAPALLNEAQQVEARAPAVEGEAAAASESLTAQQAANLTRFESKLPSAAGETAIHDLPSGGKAFQATVPGRVPGSAALYEKQVDAAGKTLQYTKTTMDPAGNVVHVKDKINGTTVTP